MKKVKIFLLSLFLLSSNFLGKKVFAQEADTMLGVSPTIVEEVLTPGETNVRRVNIFNLTNRSIPIKSQVRDFVGTSDDEIDLDESISSKEWINVEPADFILEPQSSQEVVLTITPPINAAPGGHYASVFFNPVLPADFGLNKSPKVLTRVAVQQLYLVRGEMVEKMELGWFATKDDINFGSHLIFETNYSNNGNVHIVPRGKIFVENIFSKKNTEIDLENKVILPKSSRKIIKEVDSGLSMGKYRAKMTTYYGTEQKKLESEWYEFWILPIWWQIVLTLVLGITMIIFIRVFKFIKNAK